VVKKSSPAPRSPAVLDELKQLGAKAKAGDASVLPLLRQLLDEHPEVWEYAGDLDRIAVRSWIALLAGQDPLSAETIQRKAEHLRAELEGDKPTPLERLLVRQVVVCWLEMTHAQMQMAAPGKTTPGQAGYNLRRTESTQRKYLAAIKTLITVRAVMPRGLLPVNVLKLHAPDTRTR
jgi:hypothetical protein